MNHVKSRRFWMRKLLFYWFVDVFSNYDLYFQMRSDAYGRKGLSPLQKCTATICILAYRSPINSVNEYVRIVEWCLEAFVKGVNKIFGDEYLRHPNNNNINCPLQIVEAHGFLGMLVLLITCIGNVKIAQFYGKTNIA